MRVTSITENGMMTYRDAFADDHDELTCQWTIGTDYAVSRIHNRREGWTISVSHPMIDVTQLGSTPIHLYSGQAECELELEVTDAYTVRRLMELNYQTGQPRNVSCASSLGRFYKVRIDITEREANEIASKGIHPLEVLLGPNGVTVRAVPIDMREFQ